MNANKAFSVAGPMRENKPMMKLGNVEPLLKRVSSVAKSCR
jgi:hypothetical protein